MIELLVPDILFYVFGALALMAAFRAVTSPHILRAAVFLMGMLLVTAGLYLLLQAEFIAGVQILVYVGGIVVLLLFAVMLTHSLHLREERPNALRQCGGICAAVLFFAGSMGAFLSSPLRLAHDPHQLHDTTKEIGRRLLDSGAQGYLLPFELISLLLLAVVIGGIVLAKKTQDSAPTVSKEGNV